jgi:hypothetical protein
VRDVPSIHKDRLAILLMPFRFGCALNASGFDDKDLELEQRLRLRFRLSQ